jgi:cytochrome P450
VTVGDETEDLTAAATAFLVDQSCRGDPWRFYARLHEAGEVLALWKETHLVSSFEAVSRVLAHAQASPMVRIEGVPVPLAESVPVNDAFLRQLPYQPRAVHRRLRGVVSAEFRQSSLRWLEPRLESIADAALFPAAYRPRGVDVQATLGRQIPLATSCLLLGVARGDWSQMGEWGDLLYGQIGHYGQPPELLAAASSALDGLRAYAARMIDDPLPDGVGGTIVAAARSALITEEEAVAFYALFLLTGMETSTHALSNALLYLATHAEIFDELRARPLMVPAIFDELLRLWGPVRLCVRHLEAPIEFLDTALPAGATAILLIQAANRDPRVFERPDAFSLERPMSGTLAFGHGERACLGVHLARRTGAIVLSLLARRCKRIAIDGAPAGSLSHAPRPLPSLPIFGFRPWRLCATPDAPSPARL